MQVVKILNSSVVLVHTDDREIIVFGKGIGYNHKVNDMIEENEIERKFIPVSNVDISQYADFLENIDNRIIEAANHIVDYAKQKLDGVWNDYLPIALIDHIHFAIERNRQNLKVQNRLLVEIKKIYPEEFLVGEYALEYLNDMLNENFTIEEAGNITFHIINARNNNENIENTYQVLQVIKDVQTICKYHFNFDFQPNSLDYSRFITHLEFFARRLVTKNSLPLVEINLISSINDLYTNEYACAKKIEKYVYTNFNVHLSENELMYLTIHLYRVINAQYT